MKDKSALELEMNNEIQDPNIQSCMCDEWPVFLGNKSACQRKIKRARGEEGEVVSALISEIQN